MDITDPKNFDSDTDRLTFMGVDDDGYPLHRFFELNDITELFLAKQKEAREDHPKQLKRNTERMRNFDVHNAAKKMLAGINHELSKSKDMGVRNPFGV